MTDRTTEPLTSVKIPGKDAHAIWRGTEHVGMVYSMGVSKRWVAHLQHDGDTVVSAAYPSVALTLAWCEGYLQCDGDVVLHD